MGATFPRLKTWTSTEDVTGTDLNAEFNNILDNLGPAGVDDYSTNSTQMRLTTDPGESGTESLATSLAGEIERLRHQIKEIKGTDATYWYTSSSYSLSTLGSAIGGGLPNNRITSGRMGSDSSQPIYLVPHGTNATATVKGATTNLAYSIAGTNYTITTDATITPLTTAPSTNNTCLVDDNGAADGENSKYLGEFGSELTVDTMGSEISALVGKLAGFKINNGSADEYFIARVKSTTKLTDVRRGYFFDSADAPIPRVAIADNDTITLMKAAWIFATTTSTLTVSYLEPIVSDTEPSSPSSSQYWFDIGADVWKVYGGVSWSTANAIFVGLALTDSSGTKAARSVDFFKAHSATCTVDLEKFDDTQVRTKSRDAHLIVYGQKVDFSPDNIRWDMDTDLDTGITEAADTIYYCYITEDGAPKISNVCPMDRSKDLLGYYHPYKTWRAVGMFHNNSSSNIEAPVSFQDTADNNYAVVTKVAASALTLKLIRAPFHPFSMKSATATDPLPEKISVLPGETLVVSSGSTLGTVSAVEAFLIVHGISFNKRIELGISRAAHKTGFLTTTTAEGGAGAADLGNILYSTFARTTAPVKVLTKLASTQTTAGTWATAISDYVNYPFNHTYKQDFTADATCVVPAGYYNTRALGIGGGGGGGAGGGGVGSDGGGGGGGAGAHGYLDLVLTPLESLAITVGDGGTGAAAGGTSGNTGESTAIVATAATYTWLGGGFGGRGGASASTQGLAGGNSVGPGGPNTGNGGGGSGGGSSGAGGSGTNITTNVVVGYGSGGGGGGGGATAVAGFSGGASAFFSTAAAGGTQADGGGGGGGGGSGFGIGGAGGNGANTPTAGASAAANTGAGGGGGGGSGDAGLGQAGGDGGSGRLYIFWEFA